MWKYKSDILYNLSVVGLAFSMASNLLITGFPAKIFYIVTYIAIFYSLRYIWLNRRETISDKLFLSFIGSIFLLGLIRVIWALHFKSDRFDDVLDNYILGGKRFILSIFIIFWFYKEKFRLKSNVLLASAVILIIGLALTVWQGYHDHQHIERIRLTADAATTTSYLIVILSFTTLWICQQRFRESITSVVLFVIILIMTLYLLAMTGTRSAVLSTPIFLLVYFAVNYRAVNNKIRYAFLGICLAGVIGTPWVIHHRMQEISKDISEYNTNNDTSIGARFSIWEGGWHSVKFSLIGQDSFDRTEKARAYIQKYERNNPEAYNNVKYNLHNETLEVLSLQGILGFITLMMFFLSGLVFGVAGMRKHHNGVFFIVAPIIVMGLTDTVMIQSNTALIICVAIALCQLYIKQSQPTAINH
ncbi:O-antigen ligase family protein [Ewingella americana]|uniref:O-antigen ligase family protein n=1 Tax=Ewingella americana TaxID=41202 RepID=UPI0012AD56AA|nr:O-antigen ligase family protein [Ewingella americana]MRT03565.1 hypothetical protein [Ewingella americana]